MKKFVLLAHGTMERTPEFIEAHTAWWSSMQGHVIDSGNPLFNAHDVSKDGTVAEIGGTLQPALGYSIVQAESMAEAVSLLEPCPMDSGSTRQCRCRTARRILSRPSPSGALGLTRRCARWSLHRARGLSDERCNRRFL
jgi:hypothetical protein